MIETLVKYAYQFVGLPYRWGGDDTIDGFDCSGLVQELYASIGFDPPGDQTAQALYEHFKSVSHEKLLKPGALAFYGKSEDKITHVAMFIDEKRIIEAGGGGSHTQTKEDAAIQNAYIRIRPYDRRKDLVATLYPKELLSLSLSERQS